MPLVSGEPVIECRPPWETRWFREIATIVAYLPPRRQRGMRIGDHCQPPKLQGSRGAQKHRIMDFFLPELGLPI